LLEAVALAPLVSRCGKLPAGAASWRTHGSAPALGKQVPTTIWPAARERFRHPRPG